MEVDLNSESWHQRLNNWSLKKTYQPFNLCPYWWTTTWHIFSSPVRYIWRKFVSGFNFLLDRTPNVQLPDMIAKPIDNWMAKPQSKLSRWFDDNLENIGKGIAIFFFGSLLILFTAEMISRGWAAFFEFLLAMFIALVIIAIIIAILIAIAWIGDTDTWRMIKGMVYSGYKKICPGINWQ